MLCGMIEKFRSWYHNRFINKEVKAAEKKADKFDKASDFFNKQRKNSEESIEALKKRIAELEKRDAFTKQFAANFRALVPDEIDDKAEQILDKE